MGYEQWTEHDEGAGYTATGRTVTALEPGVYDIALVNGVLIWVPVENRTEELIRFPDTPVAEVATEIEKFWDREALFRAHGLPHKRGILLWGPPGSGKTCTLALVTRDVVRRGGIVIIFRTPGVFSVGYRQLRAIQPDVPLVVLMEDIDELLSKTNKSEVLNLLDGIEATHKTVFLATTNYPESPNLGPRIVNRPSRFDRRFKIGHPGIESRKMYLETITVPGDDIDICKYAADTDGLSLAHVKELFVATVLLGVNYSKTLKTLKTMSEKPSSAYDEDGHQGFGTYA